jgi:hypothetical protein
MDLKMSIRISAFDLVIELLDCAVIEVLGNNNTGRIHVIEVRETILYSFGYNVFFGPVVAWTSKI